jgi:hypothetical protein
LWIELGDVRADAAMEDLLAIAALNKCLARVASGEEEEQSGKDRIYKIYKISFQSHSVHFVHSL